MAYSDVGGLIYFLGTWKQFNEFGRMMTKEKCDPPNTDYEIFLIESLMSYDQREYESTEPTVVIPKDAKTYKVTGPLTIN